VRAVTSLPLPDWFLALGGVRQAAVAGVFTWLLTAAGAAAVFVVRTIPRRLFDGLLGFAAGVMIAASVWSLLIPAIELAEGRGASGWATAAVGFLLGGLVLRIADRYLPHLHPGARAEDAEGVPTAWRRTTLLVLAITLHNVPEGLAVGVAFGAASAVVDLPGGATLAGAAVLALGIAIQNVPEGLAVAMPLRAEGVSRRRSFLYGQLSAAVEPPAAVLGAAAVLAVDPLLPHALAFAAGAMIFVVVEELIPESQAGGHPDVATAGTLAGFTLMMVLDVALG
jgi:ZIP family zinc transporter